MKRNRYIKVFKEFSWIAFGQFLTVIGSLFGIRLLTSLLSNEQYGELALAMTIGTFLYLTIFGPISNGVYRYFSLATKKNDTNNYLKAIQKIILYTSFFIFIFALVVIFILKIIGYSQMINLTIVSLLFGILSGYTVILNGIESASRNRRLVAFHKSLAIWLRFIFAGLFILSFGVSSTNAMLGQAIAIMIILFSQILFLSKRIKNKKDLNLLNKTSQKEWQSKIYRFSWPYASWSILAWGNNSSAKWGLEFFSGNVFVGFYAVLYQLGFYPMQLIIGLFTNFLTPFYYDKVEDGKNKVKLKNIFSLGIFIYLLIVSILSIPVIISFNYHEFIFKLFVDSKFSNFSFLLGPLMLASLIKNSTSLISLLFQAKGDVKSLVVPNNILDFIGILLSILGAYYQGIIGIVFAYLIYSLIYLLWYLILVKNQYKRILN